MAFKVTDVRVLRKTSGEVSAYIDGLGTGSTLSKPVDPLRASLMLSVFVLRRDCYWDETGLNTTTVPFRESAWTMSFGVTVRP